MLSPNFQVATFQVEEYNYEPISITYKFKGAEKCVTKELFKVGTSFPSTKSITFDNKAGNLDLMVHYADSANLMDGLPSQIAQYVVGEGKAEDKVEKHSFTMRVSNNIHNVASLDEVEFIQEWTEEEKIPVKASPVTPAAPPKADPPKEGDKPAAEGEAKPADAEKPAEGGEQPTVEDAKAEPVQQPEQKYETKQRTKKNFSKIKFSTSSFALSPAVRKQMREAEEALRDGDADILEWKELRNNLEAYSYEMRSNLDSYGSFEKYLAEPQRKTFLEQINQVVEWLYEAGETAPKEEYALKLKEFKAIGDPVKQRHFYYSELDVYFGQLEQI